MYVYIRLIREYQFSPSLVKNEDVIMLLQISGWEYDIKVTS